MIQPIDKGGLWPLFFLEGKLIQSSQSEVNSLDFRIAIDAGLGWFAARIVWLALDELVIKPALHKGYRKADELFDDKLPNIHE